MTPLIILVAGASGSGKSTVVEKIVDTIGTDICSVIPLDMFYRDRRDISLPQREQINYDHPDAIEWELLYTMIHHLKKGQPIHLPNYDFVTHSRQTEPGTIITPQSIIIIEGIMTLYPGELRMLADYKIFIETPLDICLSRRLTRDTAPESKGGRGRSYESVITQWQVVRDMYLTHFEPTKLHADVILPRGTKNEKGIHLVINAFTQLLKK